METVTDQVYAITGGNSGIGLASAHELVAQGARVAILGRNGQTLATAQHAVAHSTELAANSCAVDSRVDPFVDNLLTRPCYPTAIRCN